MNSKNHFLRSLGMALRGAFILVFVLSVFTATTPTRAAGGPDLVVTKSHSGGNFSPLENGRTYTITVTNQGEDSITDATSGMVTVVDALPPATEMTVTAISGTGWTCTLGTLTCTRSDSLPGGGASYDPITVTVNVLIGAQNPQDNQATVSGGGELVGSTSNNTSTYNIPVDAKPDLVVVSYEIRDLATNNIITSPDANQAFYIRVKVKNQGGADTSGVFYTGAFLDNKPNYGGDVPLGTVTPWSDFQISTGAGGNNKGCVFYDPPPLLDQSITDIDSLKNWGNYTRANLNNALDPGTTEDVDIKFEYLDSEGYTDALYDTLNIRSGLKAGNYTIYLYADPMCIGTEEINENNNSLQLSLSVASTSAFPSGPTNVDVTISGVSRGVYPMVPDTSTVKKYALDGGPVVISSDNGVGIIASLNQWRRRPSTTVGWTGVAQTMALPVSLITDTYYFPRYDYSTPSALYNNLLIANVDTVSRDITITIGGVVRGTYTLAPSQSQYVNYPGLVGGPVVVSSVSGARIVASLYELIRDPSLPGWNGQSEMMGLPATQLSDQYLIPNYFGAANPNTLNASLFIANVDSVSTSVEIRIAGVLRGTYPLAANTGQVVKYALDGGPVEIRSTNGANIVASLNQWRRRPSTTVGWTGVAQTMALPVSLITDTYYFPRYDYSAPSALYNNLLIANVDTVSRDITITIGGVVRGTYTLAPSQSQYVNYPGLVGGPVVVSSVSGARIVTSLYELIRDPSLPGWNGQSEMMGLPISQISDQYLIPNYFGAANPNTLNASLYIAVP